MKSFRSFNEINRDNATIFNQLDKLNTIYAHSHDNKSFETLSQHSKLVVHYFVSLVNEHNLEKIIDQLIGEISFDSEILTSYNKKLFFNTFLFHDLGKINNNFQVEKMNNPYFNDDKTISIGSEHSFLSAYIFLNFHLNEIYHQQDINPEFKNILACCVFIFTIPIIKHHSGIILKDYEYSIKKTDSIHHFLKMFEFDIDKDFTNQFLNNENKLWIFFNNFIKDKNFDYFPLFALLKLNWSLLTAADYYATSEYMNDLKVKDFGLIDGRLQVAIFKNFEKCKGYNKNLIEKQQDYLKINTKLLDKNPENLNLLRQKLGAEVLSGIEKYKNEYIFYIEAPTGGGKTNLSMVAILKLLELHPEINKVFYVFPFTTLITQTLKSIKETLGLTEEHVAQVHTKAGFQTKACENEDDAKYGSQLKNQVDNLFVNFPFTLLTHVKFFDILKSNNKKSNYLLHRLANSIVIIDEIQSYNPKHWDKVKYFISNYAKYFNIRFILMSATLPKLHNIAVSENELLKFNDLIDKAQENYLQNPNFCERVTIKPDLLDIKDISLEQLAGIVYEKSENYSKTRDNKYRNSVYTIIEFIFKRTATEFYDVIIEKNLFTGYEVFVLSGSIIEPRRKYIIEYLKDEENRKKKVLLISTQVIEAGVDIDMDLGFKNQSLIDSDEQLAGRINRNMKKDDCELWLFKCNEPSKIYDGDLRFKVTKRIENKEIRRILQEKDFNVLYQKVMEEINTINKSVYKSNFEDYQNHISSLRFNDIHSEFKLIESDTIAIFVAENIPVKCYKNEPNFSMRELNFLEKNGIYKHDEKYVSGEKTWELYISLINNKQIDYSKKNIELKILSGIMSKFVFSIFVNKIDDLKPYLDYYEDWHDYKVIQYYKLNSSFIGDENLYSLKSGLNEKKLGVSYEFF